MAKADEREERGEQLLREWGVAADAGVAVLGPLLGRDPSADVAIAHRLGAVADEASARALHALERRATDKLVRKAAKRALYRLEQRGVRVAEAGSGAAAPLPLVGAALEGYLSPLDGRGDQLVWLLKPQSSGVAQLFAVINDPEGMREAALAAVTRKALKSLRAELEHKHQLRLVPVDWHYADFLMHRAFLWGRARGTRIEGDYPALRGQMLRQPAPEALPPAVLKELDAATVGDEQLAASPALLEEPELRTWFLSPEEARPFLDELSSVRDSPLVLNQVQQQERFGSIIAAAVDAVFGGERRPSWARRLYEMAYIFAVTRRRPRAEQAVAAARALEAGRAPRDIPFCAALVRTSLAFFFQLAAEEEAEREQSSLIVTPQQAARQRERPR